MRDTIQIGGTQMEMAANAASPFLYRKIFGEDFLQLIYSAGDEYKNQDGAVAQMAYIMAMTAKMEEGEIGLQDLYGLTKDDFLMWLMSIDEPMAFADAAGDIVGLYMKTTKTTSTPKKPKGAGRSARTRQASTSSAAQN